MHRKPKRCIIYCMFYFILNGGEWTCTENRRQGNFKRWNLEKQNIWTVSSLTFNSGAEEKDYKVWLEEDDIIDVLAWDKWWDYELNNDSSNHHIAFLPLHLDLRAKFNETAAWEYVRSMVGKPYGYHNLIFSRIDTTHGNYPPPLDAHLVAFAMTIYGNK